MRIEKSGCPWYAEKQSVAAKAGRDTPAEQYDREMASPA
jgi:hypothetical protein